MLGCDVTTLKVGATLWITATYEMIDDSVIYRIKQPLMRVRHRQKVENFGKCSCLLSQCANFVPFRCFITLDRFFHILNKL